jgi:hypothetical protein
MSTINEIIMNILNSKPEIKKVTSKDKFDEDKQNITRIAAKTYEGNRLIFKTYKNNQEKIDVDIYAYLMVKEKNLKELNIYHTLKQKAEIIDCVVSLEKEFEFQGKAPFDFKNLPDYDLNKEQKRKKLAIHIQGTIKPKQIETVYETLKFAEKEMTNWMR